MTELLVDTQTAVDEAGNSHKFDYSILIGQMDMGGRFACESYGVKVAEDDGDTAAIPDITVSLSRIDSLMELLVRNGVAPAALEDVVGEWL